MTQLTLRPVLLAVAIAVLPLGALAATSGLYLNIPGPAGIPGESIDRGHEGQIDLLSLSWGASVAIAPRSGGPVDAGKPSIMDISWMQKLDKSLVPMFSSITGSVTHARAGFDFVKPGAPKGAPFLSLTAEHAMISSMAPGGGSGDDQYVSASLIASAVTLTHDPRALGGTGPAVSTRYDLAENKAEGPSKRQPADFKGTTPAEAGLYLRLGSGDSAIAGEVRAAGYENWIAIDSFSMGTSISMGALGEPVKKPSVSELSWSQALDATAPAVLFRMLSGRSIGEVAIEQVVIGSDGRPVTVMQQALNDVLFSSFVLNTNDSREVAFAGSMSFASFTQTLWPQLPGGGRGPAISFGFDVGTGKPIAGAQASSVAGFGSGSLDGTVLPTPIPEPQTWLLMLGGIAGLMAVARRRRVTAA